VGVHPAQVAVQGQSEAFGRGLRHRQRRAQDRVGAQPAFVRRAVQLDQILVDALLLQGVQAHQRLGDRLVDVLDCLQHTLAAVTLLVAVAQLDRLMLAGGRPAGHDHAPKGAVHQRHLDLNRGIAT